MSKNTSPPVNANNRRLNETHDPALRSFVASANDTGTEFPIQNLPLAMFRRAGSAESFRVGVGIGDEVLDIYAVRDLIEEPARAAALACGETSMNALMGLGSPQWSALRAGLSRLLREGSAQADKIKAHLVAMAAAEFALPAKVPNFSDFVASLHHISKVTKVKRPDGPGVTPSYVWTPLGFHCRASTIRASGHSFARPKGQTGTIEKERVILEPTRFLDYEAELAIYVGTNTTEGQSLDVDAAEEVIFGLSVLNDWTARDMQGWEQQPLGPFQAKSFTTTVSPWLVSMEALEPFRLPFARDASYPAPLPHLDSPSHRARGFIDIGMEVLLQSESMAQNGQPPMVLGRSQTTDCYWSIAQLVAHQTANGCNLEAGDLLGTGTISGPGQEACGSMIELTLGGKSPVTLPSGETRASVGDGDTVTIRAFCNAQGFRSIGFGAAVAKVLPSV